MTEEPAWAEAVTLGDALLRTAARHPDTVALAMPERSWTYAELAAGAHRTARGLVGLGVEPGDRVGVLLVNGFDCLASLFGVALAGATVVPINARFRRREMGHIVAHAGLVAVITSDASDDHVDLVGLLGESVGGLAPGADPLALHPTGAPALRTVVLLGRREVPGALTERAFVALGRDVDDAEIARRRAGRGLRDPAMVLYTSGTTDQPRGAIIAHEAIVRVWGEVARAMRLTAEDRMWNPCPMFHIAAIGVCLACVLRGTTIVTTRFFEPGESVDLLLAHRPTALYPAYPVIILGLLHHPRFGELDLSVATRTLCVGPPETLRGLQDALPQTTVTSTFGMTESCGCATMHDLDDPVDVRCATSGAPVAGLELRIADPETGAPLRPDEPGEILLRGPLLCDGYHDDPQRSAELFRPDGWMRTGDRGAADAGGQLRYLGRIKDMMKVGGESVSPAEIEGHLMSHPAVHLAQVVGIPDERLGEVPVAFVELLADASATEAELLEFCRGAIARYKIPVAVHFVAEWPMSATKVRKVELRDRLLAAQSEPVPARA